MAYAHLLIAIDLTDDCHLVLQRAQKLCARRKSLLGIHHEPPPPVRDGCPCRMRSSRRGRLHQCVLAVVGRSAWGMGAIALLDRAA